MAKVVGRMDLLYGQTLVAVRRDGFVRMRIVGHPMRVDLRIREDRAASVWAACDRAREDGPRAVADVLRREVAAGVA